MGGLCGRRGVDGQTEGDERMNFWNKDIPTQPASGTPHYNKHHCRLCLRKFLQIIDSEPQCPFCGSNDVAKTDRVDNVGEKVAFENPTGIFVADWGKGIDTTIWAGRIVEPDKPRPALILPNKECANCGNSYDLLWFTRQSKAEKLSCAVNKEHVCVHDVCSKWVAKC